MQETINKLFREIEEQLNFISIETEDILKKSELSIQVIVNALKKLKKEVLRCKFKTQSEEIKFFKNTKPQLLSKLIFHISVYNIHSHLPKGRKNCTEIFIESVAKPAKVF